MVSLRNIIGNLLIMGFDGCSIDDKSPVSKWLSGDGLGGVLLFDKNMHNDTYGKNLKTPEQIRELITTLQEVAANNPAQPKGVPLFTAIDYEGGPVDRLASMGVYPSTHNALEMAAFSDEALNKELDRMASILSDLGFNLNFAPVVDLMISKEEGIIGRLKRSYSADPHEVTRVARRFVEVFASKGIACSYKHFPGHGSALGDTHEGFVDVTETFQEAELLPYRELLQQKDKPVMIMTAHVINRRLDASGLPATLSYEILTNLLRTTMGYEGVIISDDLQMQAIADHYSLEEALCLTFNAGADMVIIGNQLGEHDAVQVIDIIEKLVENNRLSAEKLENAYQRVLQLKQKISAS